MDLKAGEVKNLMALQTLNSSGLKMQKRFWITNSSTKVIIRTKDLVLFLLIMILLLIVLLRLMRIVMLIVLLMLIVMLMLTSTLARDPKGTD